MEKIKKFMLDRLAGIIYGTYFGMVLLFLSFYLINIYKATQMAEISTMFIVRIVGAFVPPLGALLGFF